MPKIEVGSNPLRPLSAEAPFIEELWKEELMLNITVRDKIRSIHN